MLRTLKLLWQKVRGGKRATAIVHPGEAAPCGREKQALETELRRVRSELDTVSSHNAELVTTLQQRIGAMEHERENSRRQLEELSTSLADTAQRQSDAEQRILKLGLQLESAQRKQLAEAEAALERERRHERHLKQAMLVAVLALLLGTLAGAALFHNATRTTELLAQFGSDLSDIKETIRLQAQAMQSRQLSTPAGAAADDALAVQQPAPYTNVPAPEPDRQHDRAQTAFRPIPSQTDTPTRSGYRTREEMQQFFAENGNRADVITLAEGLQYRVLSRGIGPKPDAGDQVVLDYSAHLLDGSEIFVSHRESTPVSFAIEQFGPGLREALAHMQEGAQWEIYVSPDLAYRGTTRNRKRFGYEPLVYTVDLIAVVGSGSELPQQAITQ